MMNSDETWLLYMWSGVFASAVGGAVAAGVAMYVLRKTNKHQADLAKTQLRQQKIALDLQLQEQRKEATKVREIAAIADLLAVVTDLHLAQRETPESFMIAVGRLHSAGIRWRIDLEHEGMDRAFRDWMETYARAALVGSKREWPKYQDGIEGAFYSARKSLNRCLVKWPNASPHEQDSLASQLAEHRQKLDQLLTKNQ